MTDGGLRACERDSAGGFENHFVFYRPHESGIEVVRVLHGARDLESILDGDGADDE